MKLQVVDNETVVEPITLDEVKTFSRIDIDYTADDADLLQMITSARKRMEKYLNIGLAQRLVIVQMSGRNSIPLPMGPTTEVVEIKSSGEIVDPSKYFVDDFEYKTVYLNTEGEEYRHWWYSTSGEVEFNGSFSQNRAMYAIKYLTGYQSLPADLKLALKVEVDYLIKLRGMPESDGLSSACYILARPFSKNPII